jgi:hypothetical protein
MTENTQEIDPSELLFRSFITSPQVHYEESEAPPVCMTSDEYTNLPLFEEQDRLIVMHRDAHFAGSFRVMKEYYENEDSVGAIDEIDFDRICLLEQLQEQLKRDLAPLLVTGSDAEKVARARQMYKHFESIITTNPDSPEAALAGLIISEDPESVMVSDARLLEKPEELLLVAKSEELRDALFPGYGRAPIYAVRLLSKLRYAPAIPELFHLVDDSDFEMEGAAISALRAIGEESKKFLLQQLVSRPITHDNARAAVSLLDFLPDEKISFVFRQQLEIVKDAQFAAYLRLGIEE